VDLTGPSTSPVHPGTYNPHLICLPALRVDLVVPVLSAAGIVELEQYRKVPWRGG
jgi:hypothetical protein